MIIILNAPIDFELNMLNYKVFHRVMIDFNFKEVRCIVRMGIMCNPDILIKRNVNRENYVYIYRRSILHTVRLLL